MLVILKYGTSPLSAALREITKPDVVCTCALVVAADTDGVSAIGLTVMVKVWVGEVLSPGAAPLSCRNTSTLAAPKAFAASV